MPPYVPESSALLLSGAWQFGVSVLTPEQVKLGIGRDS